MTLFKKATLASALAASALVSASPAMARDYRHHGGDTAAVAIGAGILGLAIGAIAASSSNHDRDYRRSDWEYRDGYYWDRQGNRYDRDGRLDNDGRYYARRGYGDNGYYGYYDRSYRGY